MSDRTEQGRALVERLRDRADGDDIYAGDYGLFTKSADTLSWALDRIEALEGALQASTIHRCESCGPTLERVYRHRGTDWCAACCHTEGWPLADEEPEAP